MTDTEELTGLLVAQEQLLLEVAELIERSGDRELDDRTLLRYEQALGALQKSRDSNLRLLHIYLSLRPYLQQGVAALRKDKEALQEVLLQMKNRLPEVS